MNKQAEVHENGKKQEYCGFVFLERKIILTIFFTGNSIRNGRFITKEKKWDARQT